MDAVRGTVHAVDYDDLVERLAALEHEQWMEWAQAIQREEPISLERARRWQGHYVPYADLPEQVKEQDRVYARKVVAVILGE